METSAQLLLITEIAIALTGFSGIVVTFQFAGGTRKSRGDVIGLASIVQLGLITAFLAFLPLAIGNFSIDNHSVWSISSLVAAICYTIFLINLYPHTRKMRFRGFNRLVIGFWWIANIIMIIVMLLNAFKFGFGGEAGPYVAVLLNPLCFIGYMFARLLLRPLWRYIREQENTVANQSGIA